MKVTVIVFGAEEEEEEEEERDGGSERRAVVVVAVEIPICEYRQLRNWDVKRCCDALSSVICPQARKMHEELSGSVSC